MTDWRDLTLDQLGRIVTGKTPPTADSENYGGAIPFVTPSDMDGRRTISDTARYLTAAGLRTVANAKIPRRSVMVSCIGSDMGKAAIAGSECVTNQQINSIVVDDKFDSSFVYYNLSVRKDEIRSAASGSAQPIMNKSTFGRLRISVPDKTRQIAIASVLAALDDKIELNRRMNETLEAMARAIFKDWFVDFGPTRAKMEGRAPYLAPDIWSLFPDRLDDEGKPEGWITSTIGQEVEVLGGSTPSTKESSFWDGDIAWATPKDLSSLSTPALLSTERQITEAGLSQIGSGLLPAGTVLLSSRAPIGYMAIAQIPVAVNQGFIAMICNKRLSNVFVWLWTQVNMETVHQNANGSTFQEISKSNFRPIEVTVPLLELLRAFDETAKPLLDRIVANDKENRTLATTRDFLLPKLMSGEVRVGDAASSA